MRLASRHRRIEPAFRRRQTGFARGPGVFGRCIGGVPIAALILLVTQSAPAEANWWKNRDGCLVTEHIQGKGENWVIDAGKRYSYVGSRWNDRISTVICEVSCHLKVWEHRDFQGASRVISGHVGQHNYVGNAWNDRISSMQAWCDP